MGISKHFAMVITFNKIIKLLVSEELAGLLGKTVHNLFQEKKCCQCHHKFHIAIDVALCE